MRMNLFLMGGVLFLFSGIVACSGESRREGDGKNLLENIELRDSGDMGDNSVDITEKSPEIKPRDKPQDDLGLAEHLWNEMKNYRNWERFPGREGDSDGFIKSSAPHGSYARIFVNKKDDLNGYGSIIVKENFNRKDIKGVLVITVMKKIENYNPDDGDWFWAEYNPS